MVRYFFDVRDGMDFYPDDEGIEFAAQTGAEAEAARAILELLKDTAELQYRHDVAIEVRTEDGPVFQAAFVFETNKSTLQ